MAMLLTIALLFWFFVWVMVVGPTGNATAYVPAVLTLWLVTGWVPVLLFKLFG